MASLQTARSLLFAPGSDERKLTRALASEADVVVADLEDAVAAERKDEARGLTCALLSRATTEALRFVRVNAVGTAWFEADLAAVRAAGVDGIVLPKATPAAAREVTGAELPVIAIVESALGLRTAFETARIDGVVALQLGAVDLGLDLGLEPRADGQELLYARSSVVVDSAAAGLRGPLDQVWVNVRDPEGLERDCLLGRSLGFRGKACIHPDQVPVVNAAFLPSEREVDRARRLVEVYEAGVAAGRGAVLFEGEMIDLPVVERARALLSDAKRSVLDVE